MSVWKYTVKDCENGFSIEKILKIQGFNKKQISRQKFLENGILLDGVKCRVSESVRGGQVLCLGLSDSKEKQEIGECRGEKLRICYEDSDVLVLNKPSGLSSHPGRGHYKENLGTLAMGYLKEKGEECVLREIGRLDKDTSGLMLFAKNQVAAARLWEQKEDGRCQKVYQAVVQGILKENEGMIDFPIGPDGEAHGYKNKMCVDASGKRAVTFYKVKGTSKDELTLVECTLLTGRTHQIRVHMSAIGHPVCGDVIYGKRNANRLCLHAGELTFYQPFTGEKVVVREDMEWTDINEGVNG